MSNPPVTISVHVNMCAPSFVPGSTVRATVTLRADRPSSTPPATSSTTLTFGRDEFARANYVVAEVSGRWTSDRAWVLPQAHVMPGQDALDNHRLDPVAEQPHTTREALPWSAALADANAVGGGGRMGYAGIVFRSQTLVVCEREQIPVGSQVSFEVTCVLPELLPPTLKGVAMRYMYALVIVADFPGCAVPQSVRVPFRVVSAGGTAMDVERAGRVIEVPTPRGVGPVPNRFLEEGEVKALHMAARLLKSAPPDDIEIALALSLNGRLTPYKADGETRRTEEELQDGALSFIRDGTFVNTPRGRKEEVVKVKKMIPVYGIALGKMSIARMYLTKRVHHLGDSISAVFQFDGEAPCYQLGARLEMHEVVNEQFAVGEKGGGGGVVFRTVFGEHAEFVMSNRNTYVTFSVPHDAPPSFCTRVVQVKWLIHFVFLIPEMTVPEEREEDGNEDEIRPLLQGLRIEENGNERGESLGWEGGAWEGEDPHNWTHLPKKNVDVLKWTLPIVISGQHGSPWGSRSSGKLSYTRPGS